MPFADSSLTGIRASGFESAYGVSPTGTYLNLRMVSEDLGADTEALISDEITPDRRPPDNIKVGAGGSGTWQADLTGGLVGGIAGESWNRFFRMGMGAGAFSALSGNFIPNGVTVTPSNAADPDEVTFVLSTGTWPTGLVAGDFVTVSGWTGANAPLNSIYKLKSPANTTSPTTNTITLACGPRMPTGFAPQVTGTNTFGIFALAAITDGTEFRSVSIERQYSLASQFALLSGFSIQGFDIDMPPKRPCRVTWRFMGKEENNGTSTIAGATTNVSIAKAFTLGNDLRSFSLDENGHDFFLNSFRLSVDNGLYPQDERGGVVGPVGLGLGTLKVTGRYEFYYCDDTVSPGVVHDQYQRFVQKELHVGLGNANGEWFFVHLPRINWTNGRRSTTGKDQAQKGWVEFQAAEGAAYLLKLGHL